MRRSRIPIAALTLSALLLATTGGAAEATFPGSAGRIAYLHFVPDVEQGWIFTANPDGSHERVLVDKDSGAPDFSPDGRLVAFEFVASNGCTDEACEIEIGLIGSDGTGFRQLTSGDPGFRFHPSWSPDGRRLVIGRPDGLWTIDAVTGGDERQVTGNPNIEDRAPTWSPDGQWIAFTRVDKARRKSEQTALFRIHPDGTGLKRLTAWGENTDQADWSPDGRWIAFNTKGAKAPSRIAAVRPDGSGEHDIVKSAGDDDFHDPSWAPDGSRLIFQGWLVGQTPIPPHPERERALWIVNADGTDLHRIKGAGPGGPDYLDPDWGSAALAG
jgi:Tol biopolymer transport system component